MPRDNEIVFANFEDIFLLGNQMQNNHYYLTNTTRERHGLLLAITGDLVL